MKHSPNFKMYYRLWLCLWTFALATTCHLAAVDMPLRWRWSNPTPHGGNVFDMAYGLGLTVQVAERGQIYTSEDLEFWVPRESGTTNAMRAVTFFGNRLIITGESGTALWADSLEQFNLLSLGTTNWLEGVAASSDTIVAVGDNGSIYESTTGTNWTHRTDLPSNLTNWMRGVTVGGNIFVAVGENGRIAKRANNGTWSVVTNVPTSQHLNKVAFIGNTFWAVGENGTVLTANSSAGTWTAVTTHGVTTNSIYAVAGTNNSVVLVGDKTVRLSENGGTSWTDELFSASGYPAPSWTYFSALWEGSLYFIAGRSGMMVEGFETNGPPMAWITRTDPIRNWLWDVINASNFYVAVGDHGTVMTSDDGVNWDLELVPDAVTNSIFLGVGGTTNGLVAVGNHGSILFSPNIITNVISTNILNSVITIITNPVSTVGVLWNTVGVGATANDLQGVTLFNNLWVACGANGTILTSLDGNIWLPSISGVSTFLSSVTAFPGGLVATGDRGTILTSANGILWTARTSGTTNWVYRVRYLNGGLIAVGENGTILTSSNGGSSWTPRTSGTTKWLNGVDYVDGAYFAVGNQGTVLISTNATTWSNVGTLTQKSLYGVAGSSDGQLVTAGIEGAALRSQLLMRTNSVNFISFSRASGQNLYSFAGKTDQKFKLQRSQDLSNATNWIDGITLEILDRTGTVLLLENADTNNLPKEFYRTLLVP